MRQVLFAADADWCEAHVEIQPLNIESVSLYVLEGWGSSLECLMMFLLQLELLIG